MAGSVYRSADRADIRALRPIVRAHGHSICKEQILQGPSQLLRAGGWTPIAEWSDPKDWFALILCEAQPLRTAP